MKTILGNQPQVITVIGLGFAIAGAVLLVLSRLSGEETASHQWLVFGAIFLSLLLNLARPKLPPKMDTILSCLVASLALVALVAVITRL